MSEKTIHVVFGDQGAYSDYRCWPVRAFEDAAEAEKYSAECQRHHDEADERLKWREDETSDRSMERLTWKNPLDPSSGVGFDHVRYMVSEVPTGWPLIQAVVT
jgi:hypothetical protein